MSAAPRRPQAAVLVFIAALVATGVMLLVWFTDLTFWRDEWGFLLHRRGLDPDVFLRPHYEHIAISLIAVYKALLAIFGMDSPRPFQVVAVTGFAASIALLFVYVRRCSGAWVALAVALPILVLGPAWDDLLWPFQVGFFGSMSAGLGALLALELRERRGDPLACALLVVSITFSSLGLPFALGAAVRVAWDRDRWRRAFVAAVPLGVYALWWLGWGHEADSYLSLHNLATIPSYVLDGFASSLSSLLGLATPTDVVASPLSWGRVLLVGAVALAVWRLHRVGRPSRALVMLVVIAISFWFLAGLNASIFREPTSGRYQYMGAIFVVLIAAELLRGVRVERAGGIAVVAVSVAAALSNLHLLHASYLGLTGFGELQPADLAALELTRDTVEPQFQLTEENSGVDYLGFLDAGSYFSAIDAFGSPAYTPAELAGASEPARAAADRVFGAALSIGLRPAAPGQAGNSGCTTIELGDERTAVELGPAGAMLGAAPTADVDVRLRRYASNSFPVAAGSIRDGETALLEISQDRSSEPWELGLAGSGRVDVCRPEAG